MQFGMTMFNKKGQKSILAILASKSPILTLFIQFASLNNQFGIQMAILTQTNWNNVHITSLNLEVAFFDEGLIRCDCCYRSWVFLGSKFV